MASRPGEMDHAPAKDHPCAEAERYPNLLKVLVRVEEKSPQRPATIKRYPDGYPADCLDHFRPF